MSVFQQIYNLFEGGNYADCLRLCQRVIDENPLHYYPWFYRGKSLYELGDFGYAIEAFSECLKIAPNEDQIWMSLGCALECNGQKLRALKCYREEVKLFPNSPLAWQSLAGFLSRSNKFFLARRIFSLIESKGLLDYDVAALDYAKAIYEAGTLEEEISLYKKLLSTGMSENWIKENLGNAEKAILDAPG
jgi:tetratricopeptide (TPR) repeat protein